MENVRLKQQVAAQDALYTAAVEAEKQKSKHAHEIMSLMGEKQAAIDETYRYKRQVEELNNALERVKRELRGEIITHSQRVKIELRGEFTAESERVKSEIQQDSSKKFENIRQEIEECRNETSVRKHIFIKLI